MYQECRWTDCIDKCCALRQIMVRRRVDVVGPWHAESIWKPKPADFLTRCKLGRRTGVYELPLRDGCWQWLSWLNAADDNLSAFEIFLHLSFILRRYPALQTSEQEEGASSHGYWLSKLYATHSMSDKSSRLGLVCLGVVTIFVQNSKALGQIRLSTIKFPVVFLCYELRSLNVLQTFQNVTPFILGLRAPNKVTNNTIGFSL